MGKIILATMCLAIVVFGNGLQNKFVGDDIPQIVDNTAMHSLSNVLTFFGGGTFFSGGLQKMSGVYYKPLLMVYFSTIYSLFGPNPFVFHLFQLCLHILAVLLVYFILSYFFNTSSALFCSLIFMIHPINSEVVFYISDSQDVLFFCFGMLGMWTYLKTNSFKSLCLAGLLLFASILAKETGVLFFVIVSLYCFTFDRKRILPTLSVLVTVFSAYMLLRIYALGGVLAKSDPIAPIEKLDFLHRLINMPELLMFYARTVTFPINLSYMYNWTHNAITFRYFFLPLICCLFLLTMVIYLGIRLSKLNHKDYFKKYIFFGIWFCLGIVLHLHIVPLDVTVAERWFYFPMAGLLGMMIAVWQGFNLKFSNRNYGLVLAVAVLTVLSLRTAVRSFDFRNEYTLDSHDIKVSTQDYNLENGMASDLLKMGRSEEAKFHALNSIRLNPYWSNHNTLGSIYLSQGEYDKARDEYLKALTYNNYYQIYENLAGLTLVIGTYQDNIKLVESYIKLFPQHPKLWLYLAINQYQNRLTEEAKYSIRKAQSLNSLSNPEIIAIYNTIISDKPLIINLKVGKTDIPK